MAAHGVIHCLRLVVKLLSGDVIMIKTPLTSIDIDNATDDMTL